MAAAKSNNDWRVGRSLPQRLRYMFKESYDCDVTFSFGSKSSEENIEAHRMILVCASPVFESMLAGRWSKEAGVIAVGDVEPAIFRDMLGFLYSDEIKLTGHNVLPIMYTATKYLLTQLTERCLQYLAESIDVENVCTIWESALLYDNQNLASKCMNFVLKHADEVFVSPEFSTLSHQSLMSLIESDDLICSRESNVYNACIAWADHTCELSGKAKTDANRRVVLGPATYEIRFPTMSNTELLQAIDGVNILTPEEMTLISSYNRHVRQDTGGHRTMKFKTQPRWVLVVTSTIIIDRFASVNINGWVWNGSKSAIDFICDTHVELIGIGLYGGKSKGMHDIHVKLMTTSNKLLVDAHVSKLQSDGDTRPIAIMFPRHVNIAAGTRYSVVAHLKGDNTHRGVRGVKVVHSNNVKVTFLDSQQSMNDTDVSEGQIPRLLLKKI